MAEEMKMAGKRRFGMYVGAVLLLLVLVIVPVSADTLTNYTSGGSDGYVSHSSNNVIYPTLRNYTGQANSTGDTYIRIRLQASTTSGQYAALSRLLYIFDTSGIPDGATITGWEVGLHGYGTSPSFDTLGKPTYALSSYRPNLSVISNDDYSRWDEDTVPSAINYTAIRDDTYNVFTGTNLSIINKTGNTPVMLRDSWDFNMDNTSMVWSSSANTSRWFYFGETANTSRKPYIRVTYTLGTTTTYPVNLINDTRILPNSDTALPATGLNVSINVTPDAYEQSSFVIKPSVAVTDYTITATDLTDGLGHTLYKNATDIRVVKAWYQSDNKTDDWNGAATLDEELAPELLLKNDSIVSVDYDTKLNTVHLFVNGTPTDYVFGNSTRDNVFPAYGQIYDNGTETDNFPMPFALPINHNKQVWMTTHPPADQAAGNYTGQIWINSTDTDPIAVNFSVRVLPFTLPEPTKEYSIYYLGTLLNPTYGSLTIDPDYKIDSFNKSETQMAVELANIKEHGFKYPTMYDSWCLEPLCSASAESIKQTNFTKSLVVRNQSGLPLDKLYLIYALMITNQGHLTNPALQTSELLNWTESIEAVTGSYGFGKVYGAASEELGANEASRLAQRPAFVTLYNNSTGTWFADTVQNGLSSVADVTSVRVSAGSTNGGLFNNTFVSVWKAASPSSDVLIYYNPQLCNEAPETLRENYGLLLWNSSFDGAMPYVYNREKVPWNDYQLFGGGTYGDHTGVYRGHVMAYQKTYGVIDTVQWEGLREGIDDSRYSDYLTNLTGSNTSATTIINSGVTAGKDMSEIRGTLIAAILDAMDDPPTASFTSNVTSGVNSQEVQFNDTSIPIGTMTAWTWSYQNFTPGNNTKISFSSDQDPVRTFGVGNWKIYLQATNGVGTNETDGNYWINVTYEPPAPTAAFSADVTTGSVPLHVHFTDASTGTPTSWKWYMGDDETLNSILQNPEMTFTDVGLYNIRLNATNAYGSDWENKTAYINATAAPVTPIPTTTSGNWTSGYDDVDLSGIFAAMIILGLCPMIFGIGLAMYALAGKAGADQTGYLMLGVSVAVVGTIIIVILWALVPVFAGSVGA